MATVGGLVDRAFREYLHAPDDLPAYTTLAANVLAAATSWTYDPDLLTVEELDLINAGAWVECGRDIRRVEAIDTATNTITVSAAAQGGTTAADHTAGDPIYIAPPFTRQSVFHAVCDNVVALYPSLYRQTSTQVTTASTHVEVPAAAISPVEFIYQSGDNWLHADPEWRPNFPPSSTGKAIITRHVVSSGVTAHFTYRAKFDRPDDEADDLTVDFGVEEWWERIVVCGAVLQVVAGRDLDSATQEFITEQIKAQNFPVGSARDVARALEGMRRLWLDDARRQLLAEHGEPVLFNAVLR